MSIVFGVLCIVLGVISPILLGIWGFALTGLFAVLAGIFAVRAKKNGGSAVGGIITAIIGIVFGLAGMVIMVSMSSVVSEEAKKQNLPILSEHAEKLKYGMIGFFVSVTNDGEDLEALNNELKNYKGSEPDSSTTGATTTAE